MNFNPYLIICLILILQSCNNKEHIRTYRLPKSQAPYQAEESKSSVPKLNWEKPKAWIPSIGSSMRLLSFEVPYGRGNKGDLSVIQLEGTGGGIEPNINRWRRQLGLEPESLAQIEKELKSRTGKIGKYQIITIVNNNNAFLVAIIPIQDNTIFVKLSINSDGIADLKSDFESFCSSLHFVD